MKGTILLYGDSLVFGKVPGENRRYAKSERIGGYLGELIDGDVIEEGLRGRTLNGENGFFEDRDGLAHFGHTVGSHLPVDCIVLLLGTNDCNSRAVYCDIVGVLNAYMSKLADWAVFLDVELPRLVLCIPPSFSEEHFDEGAAKIFGEGAQSRLSKLTTVLAEYASSNSVEMLDLSDVIPGKGDGVHLNPMQNKEIAERICAAISRA